MKCQKCGSEYEGSVCPNGCNNSGTAKKKPIYKRWWFWLIIAIVVVSVASSGGEETSVPDETGVKSENVSANTDASETTAAMEATTEATVVDPYYHVGDTIEANGLKINIVSIEKWESSNQFIQPEDGYQYFRVFISAENTSSADRYLSSFEFTANSIEFKMSLSLIPPNTILPASKASGRSVLVLIDIPGKFKISLSSGIVPLSDNTQNAFFCNAT